MSSTYFKTRKGQEEIENRSGGLTPRARRLLIMIDGKRPLDELRAMLADNAFEDTLAMLVTDGYVSAPEPVAPPPAPAPSESPPEVATADGAQREFNPKQLEMARNFMMNTLTKFNGPYAKLGLMKRVHESRNPQELDGLFEDWLRAISETRMGKLRAEELKLRLREVLDTA